VFAKTKYLLCTVYFANKCSTANTNIKHALTAFVVLVYWDASRSVSNPTLIRDDTESYSRDLRLRRLYSNVVHGCRHQVPESRVVPRVRTSADGLSACSRPCRDGRGCTETGTRPWWSSCCPGGRPAPVWLGRRRISTTDEDRHSSLYRFTHESFHFNTARRHALQHQARLSLNCLCVC